jgi:thiol-disulfide isomerase/thioredoxin
MKSLIFAIVSIFSISSSAICQEKRTIVSGIIPTLKGNENKITLWLYNENRVNDPSRWMTTSLNDGKFSFDFIISDRQTFSFKINGEGLMGYDSVGSTGSTLLVEPGDSLFFTIPNLNSRYYTDIKVVGQGAEKYEFLSSLNAGLKKVIQQTVYLNGLDQAIKMKAFFVDILDNKGMTLGRPTYVFIRSRLMGLLNYSCITTLQAMESNNMEIKQVFKNYANLFPIDEMCFSAAGNVSYGDVIIERAIMQDRLMGANIKKRQSIAVINLLIKEYGEKAYLSRLCAGYLADRAKKDAWTSDIDEAARRYFSTVGENNLFAGLLLQLRDMLNESLTPGTFVMKYSLYDTKGKELLLSSLEGKVVLIDFMFNGCGGCVQIAPELDDLKNRIKSDNVVFVSVSIDGTLDKFNKGIGKYSGKESLHLYTGGVGANHAIIKDFGIREYPTLVLIGKDGKVIAGRAPDVRTTENKTRLYNMIVGAL